MSVAQKYEGLAHEEERTGNLRLAAHFITRAAEFYGEDSKHREAAAAYRKGAALLDRLADIQDAELPEKA